jgi:hypothetical protein
MFSNIKFSDYVHELKNCTSILKIMNLEKVVRKILKNCGLLQTHELKNLPAFKSVCKNLKYL